MASSPSRSPATAPLVRVTVTDEGAPHGPALVDDPNGEHGRGLVVVNALAVRAGVHGDYHGRRVWADIGWDAVSPAPAMPAPSPAPARLDDAAIRDGEAALGHRFANLPAWYGRATHAWWALTEAGLLSHLPEARPTFARPGYRQPPHDHAHRCA